MARNYPRFLFSNPKNTKSEGPFCVHLLSPKVICKVSYDVNQDIGSLTLEPLEFFDSCSDHTADKVLLDMKEWLFSQILTRQIKI